MLHANSIAEPPLFSAAPALAPYVRGPGTGAALKMTAPGRSGSATLVVKTLSSIQCVATTLASIPYVMLLLPRPLFLMQRHY